MARMTIEGPLSKVLDESLGGTPNVQLKAWFDFAKGQNNVIARSDVGTATTSLGLESSDTNFSPIALALSQGFAVTGAPVCIKMTTTNYNQNVPAGISNRLKEDGTTVRKWSEWKDSTHNHMDAEDGDKLVFGNSWGEELSSDELLVLLGGGYNVMMAHEAVQYYPELGPI